MSKAYMKSTFELGFTDLSGIRNDLELRASIPETKLGNCNVDMEDWYYER